MTFRETLAMGKVGESAISRWLQARGNAVLPAYEIEMAHGKGPQLFSGAGDFVAPDMLVFADGDVLWVEAKHKSHFTWHRNTRQWTTGIDLRHYEEYQRVARQTGKCVWLMFWHPDPTPSQDDIAHGCPSECPTGLFGGSLSYLKEREHHRCEPFDATRAGMKGHGRSGMVYWSADVLKLLTRTLAEAA